MTRVMHRAPSLAFHAIRSRVALAMATAVVMSVIPALPVSAAPAARARATTPGSAASARPERSGSPRDLADPLLLRGLQWRNVGPYRGGRVTAVTGVPGQRNVYYFGGTGSGIWKTTDGGVRWKPVSDGSLGSSSVGAIAVAPSDPNVVYAGMGEGCIRGNLSQGDGVYRSLDAGRTWIHMGLADARQIGRIRVHPREPDHVYVAALGHAFGPNHERGVFRSLDGGRTWKNVLFVNDSTGAIDLSMSAANPRVLYATTWQVVRTPWSLESGGRGSGLYRSTDGGDSWQRLVGAGLPKGLWGRAGVTISPANPDRVWAVIEADDGGVFRSDDAGRTWNRVNEDRNLRQRAWYYTHVFADPKNADGVYVLNVQCQHSQDGGRTFATLRPPHGDNHDLWIDPDDPQRMIESNDGGATVTTDGGVTWTGEDNQPTAQFYHVVTDDGFPYRLYGAQQDNTTVSIASRTRGFGIGAADWYDVGGCESGYVTPKRGDPNVVYAGCYDGYVGRLDRRIEQERNVSPWPENPMGSGAEAMKYRFQWTFPIVMSPHDSNTVYAGANVLFESRDEGQSWNIISPDLTRNDPTKLGSSGGPITQDNTSIEYYCTIFAMAESPVKAGVLWVGSDDGLVHVTQDGGHTWSEVTPPALPKWSMISQIDPSPHDAGTAYVAANRYKLEDDRPYVFVTRDYGRSWRSLAAGLPVGAFARAVREDPVKRGLLFCGTETGVYWSIDDGNHWAPLRLATPGAQDAYRAAARRATATAKPESAATLVDEEPRGLLPVVPVTDLVIKDDDLVISTQGRAFWILDGIGALRELTPAVTAERVHLFTPGAAWLFGGPAGGGNAGNIGGNPPRGVAIDYLLRNESSDRDTVTLEFLDGAGTVIRKFTSRPAPDAGDGVPPQPVVPAQAGLNRFVWNLREAEASRFKGLILWGGTLDGPEVVPGTYRVRLTAGGVTQTRAFEVKQDPRVQATPADLRSKHDFQLRIRDQLTAMHDAITRLRDVRDQVAAVAQRAKPLAHDSTLAVAAKSLSDKLTKVEEALYQTKLKSSQDPLNYPIRLNNKLADLGGVLDGVDARPTVQAEAVYTDLAARIDAQLSTLSKLLNLDLADFNRRVREQQIPAVVVKGDHKKPAVPIP